jgi:hypothetical protein
MTTVQEHTMTTPACTTCVLCLREDEGHSNLTIDGTVLHCLAGLNPALDGRDESLWRDMTPELAAVLDVALTCPRYREGTPAWLDVEHEGFTIGNIAAYTDDAEAAALLMARLTITGGSNA